jgi:hypothetical protein
MVALTDVPTHSDRYSDTFLLYIVFDHLLKFLLDILHQRDLDWLEKGKRQRMCNFSHYLEPRTWGSCPSFQRTKSCLLPLAGLPERNQPYSKEANERCLRRNCCSKTLQKESCSWGWDAE